MVRKYSIYAMFTALIVAISFFVIIPIPGTNGFVTLVDVGIFTASLLFGAGGGFFVGALSGGLIDLLSGYSQWIIFSFLIHGLQGFVTGKFAHSSTFARIFGLGLGCLIMIVGYALASWLLYGWPTGIASIPSNAVQSIGGALVAVPFSHLLRNALPARLQKVFLNK